MKKAFFAFLLMASQVSVAQNKTKGLKAGINISHFSGDLFEASAQEAIVGFHAGGFFNFKIAGFFLQPELLISTAGTKLTGMQENEKLKITYITIPVMLKIAPAKGFYVEAGPQAGFKISEKVSQSPLDNFIKDIDLSLGLGLGYQSKNGLGIGGRYLAGLSKVGNFEDNTTPNFKNGIFQLSLFFSFFKK